MVLSIFMRINICDLEKKKQIQGYVHIIYIFGKKSCPGLLVIGGEAVSQRLLVQDPLWSLEVVP